MLNTTLLIACIFISLTSVLYIFFWNRLLGALVGLLLRLLLWNRGEYSIWVDFGSVHLSLLAGRLILKDFRYHSSNQTVRLVKCQVSWRYWIRHAAEEEDLINSSGGEGVYGKSRGAPHCRIHISVEGFEWFLYNRTAAFEDILNRLNNDFSSKADRPRSRSRTYSADVYPRSSYEASKTTFGVSGTSIYPPYQPVFGRIFYVPALLKQGIARMKKQLPHLHPRNLLPISFDCTKAAITCGNHSTESLILAQFRQAEGTYGLVKSRSPLDLYKQALRIKFVNATIGFISNNDLWDTSNMIGKDVNDRIEHVLPTQMHESSWLLYRKFQRIWHRCVSPKQFKAMFVDHRSGHNQKSSREKSNGDTSPRSEEYAIDRKLLETPILELNYYADVAGEVHGNALATPVTEERIDVGNCDLAPEWGIDFVVHGGFFRYGPWADRQRAILQRAFFPPTYHRASPTAKLRPGDQRLSTSLKIFLELRNGAMLHIPFREASKDWQWDGQTDVPLAQNEREAASIQIRAGDKSTVKYLVPMVADGNGYLASLDMHIDTVSITSSLNDIRILSAKECHISANMPSPLKWNDERDWGFNISFTSPVLYLLRDHINMFTDLGKDWSSGPPSDFHCWVPMMYSMKINFDHYELHLYGNDHNIIDRPLIEEENTLFTIHGTSLRTEVVVPSNTYRPESTAVSFWIDAPEVGFRLTLPRWNTHAMQSSSVLDEIAHIQRLRIDASFLYFAEVRDDYVERLRINMKCSSPTFKLFGWVVRHVMVLRENYFGGFTHFSTTHEYLEKSSRNLPIGDPLDLKYRKGKSNVFQVDLGVSFEDGLVVMPAGLPGFEHARTDEVRIGACAIFKLPELQVYMRLHEYYMELSVNADPLTIAVASDCHNDILSRAVPDSYCKDVVSIEGFDITSNRLFGPQPHTAAYVCIWEIHCGRIGWTLSAAEGQIIFCAGRAFLHGYADLFNAPAAEFAVPLDPDATFLKVAIDGVDGLWFAHPAALRFSLPDGFQFDTNNLAGSSYRSVTSLRVPFAGVQTFLATQSKTRWLEAASLGLDICLDLYKCPVGWQEDAERQKRFLSTQDSLTQRVKELYEDKPAERRGGFTRGSLYLPPVHLPEYVARAEPGNPRLKERHDDEVEHAGEIYRRGSMSESDGEQHISEFDRDERLANSRPKHLSVPTSLAHEHQNLSSGDESDEASSSASRRSWSDFSDAGEGDDSRPRKEKLSSYANVCRHFCLTSNPLHPEDRLQSVSFVADHRPLPMHGPWYSSSTSPGHSLQIVTGTQESERDVEGKKFLGTILRLKSFDGIDVFVTPLLTWTASSLLEDAYSAHSSPELRVDAIVSEVVGLSSQSTSGLLVDSSINSLRLSSVQDIMSVDEAHAFMTSTPPQMGGSSRTRFVSVVEYLIAGLHTLVCFPSKSIFRAEEARPVTGSLRMEQSSLKVGTMISTSGMNGLQTFRSPVPVLQVGLGAIVGSFLQGKADIKLESYICQIQRNAPETVGVSVRVIMKSIKSFLEVHERCANRSRLQLQQLVRMILDSCDETSADLLSTIQPSFLVQGGRPREMRKNINWKFLFFLRSSIRHITEATRLDMEYCLTNSPDNHVDIPDIAASLDRITGGWRVDGERVKAQDIPVVQSLYKMQGTANKKRKSSLRTWLQSASFTSNLFKFTYDDFTLDCANEVILGPILLRTDVSKRYLLPSPTSLKDSPSGRNHTSLMSTIVTMVLDDIQLAIFPSLIPFLQHVLHVEKVLANFDDIGATCNEEQLHQERAARGQRRSKPFVFDIHLSLRSLCIQVAADKIVFELGIAGVSSSTMIFSRSALSTGAELDISLSHVTAFDELSMKVKERFSAQTQPKRDNLLASITLTKGLFNGLKQIDSSRDTHFRAVLQIGELHLAVPRSAIRLYNFFEKWQEEYLSRMDTMMRSFFDELRKSPNKAPSADRDVGRSTAIQFQISSPSMRVSLQVMHGTWLSWQIADVLIFLRTATTNVGVHTYDFGLHVASQLITIASALDVSKSSKLPSSNSFVQLELPSIRVTGSYDGHRVTVLTLVDFLRISIKPTHWDALLTVQQKFGQDFNDLLLLIADTRRKRIQSDSPEKSSNAPYEVFAKFRGFRIGLEAAPSTLFLQCDDIDGSVAYNDKRRWQINFSDLALSLSPRAYLYKPRSGFNRQKCSAFVILDAQADNHDEIGHGGQGVNRNLGIAVTKLHAVMQPSSISEIGDYVDHLQAEVLLRKEGRAHDLRDFKEKARSVTRTFNVNARMTTAQGSFFTDRSIRVKMKNFGAAFPLTLDQNLEVPRLGSEGSSAVKAFLFSINTLSFKTLRGETGQAYMEGFSFQFVQEFRQSIPSDYSGEAHETTNRLLYPEMTAHVRSETKQASRQFRLGADISGFILDLDPSITDYVFSVIDVYNHGRNRMERLAAGIPRGAFDSPLTSPVDEGSTEAQYAAVPTSNIQASLSFHSGTVRVYSTKASSTSAHVAIHRIDSNRLINDSPEIFALPEAAVWCEFKATPAAQKVSLSRGSDPTLLLFRSTVYSSQNTLRPSLLPFFTEIVRNIEEHLHRAPPSRPAVIHNSGSEDKLSVGSASGTLSSLHVSFGLRIDKSKLELTCQPDVNVIAGLYWESGGFVVNISPGARRVSIAGSVDGLTTSLKHGYLSEHCAQFDARNLAFSVTFVKAEARTGSLVNSISVVIDTELAGSMRLSRLQDLLCFKAVWLDRIPVIGGDGIQGSTSSKSSLASSAEQSPKQAITTALLFRARRIELQVDLGQSISHMTLILDTVLFRTLLAEDIDELSLVVERVDLTGTGNLSGYVRTSNSHFQTVRRRQGSPLNQNGRSKMLQLTLKSGALDILLLSDEQWLLQYRAEPLDATVFDDWALPQSINPSEARELRLSFVVKGTKIVAYMTLSTVPKLVTYAGKFTENLEAQRDGASRESQVFRSMRSPKPDNTLSEVAHIMMQSARSKFKESDNSSYSIGQRMSLHLEELVFVLFPRTANDVQLARFRARDVSAQLDREVDSHGSPKERNLVLSLAHMAVAQSIRNPSAAAAKPKDSDVSALLEIQLPGTHENVIFSLPAMDMRMLTNEVTIGNGSKELKYDFDSKFIRQEGRQALENISITFNLSLYSWLTDLRSTFARDLKRAQETAEWRTGDNVTSPIVTTATRRKTLESGVSPVVKDLLDAPSSVLPVTSPPRPALPQSPATAPETVVDSVWASGAPQSSPPTTNLASGSALPSLSLDIPGKRSSDIVYTARKRHIERLTVRQLGEATPDVMHPFFTKKAGFNLETSLPQYVHEYATLPVEQIMKVLVKIYSKQLRTNKDTKNESPG